MGTFTARLKGKLIKRCLFRENSYAIEAVINEKHINHSMQCPVLLSVQNIPTCNKMYELNQTNYYCFFCNGTHIVMKKFELNLNFLNLNFLWE